MTLTLTAGSRQIDLSTPVCMGIINATPDSFSDGSQLAKAGSERFAVDVDKALRRAETMSVEGALIIDIGGESTRPGANEVSVQEELDRVMPVVEALRNNLDICLSVDTSSPQVMQAAIAAGVELINDIRALQNTKSMELIAKSRVAVCVMHMQGQPRTMQKTFSYTDVVAEVWQFLQERIAACQQHDIDRSRIIVDPGFGFGKSVQHNYQLLKNLHKFTEMNVPLLVGVSRKSMIAGATDRPLNERLAGSITATAYALLGGANIIRTHDVAATIDAIRVHSVYSQA